MARTRGELTCSFCGKPQSAVRKLIAGSLTHVYICNECVEAAGQVMFQSGDEEFLLVPRSGVVDGMKLYKALEKITANPHDVTLGMILDLYALYARSLTSGAPPKRPPRN